MHSMFLIDSAKKEPSLTLETNTNITLYELLNTFCKDDETLLFKLIDEQKNLRPHVNIFIGSINCKNLNGINSILSPDDEVSVFPALSGG